MTLGTPTMRPATSLQAAIRRRRARTVGIGRWHRAWLPAVATVLSLLSTEDARSEDLSFLSTQFSHAAEATKLKQTVLNDFPEGVAFAPQSSYDALAASLRAHNARQSAVIGALHGELVSLQAAGLLGPSLSDESWYAHRSFSTAFADLAHMGKAGSGYVPWIFATYLMVAHRSALPYLPPGARLDELTYAQLADWGERMAAASGRPRIGLPLGEGGLIHRLVQGFLYPSFTGTMVKGFRSPPAEDMWRQVKAIWSSVDERSLSYDTMSGPLASGEVWVAWDHTARLLPLFMDPASPFVAFPAPLGPRGRGHMVALAGLAVGPGADPAPARRLIQFLTTAGTQSSILLQTGFLPVIDDTLEGQIDPPLANVIAAARRQTQAEHAALSSLPPGELGTDSRLFNAIYTSAFSEIVVRGRPIEASLARHGSLLAELFRRQKAPCPMPDPTGPSPCIVD